MNVSTESALPANPPQSRTLGITSLILGVTGLALYFMPFIMGYIMGYFDGIVGIAREINCFSLVNVVGWIVSLCGNVSGLAAMIVGSISLSREKKNVYGIIGIVLGILLVCGCLANIAYNFSQI